MIKSSRNAPGLLQLAALILSFAAQNVAAQNVAAQNVAAQVTAREDLRIGDVNSAGPTAFHQITAMTIGPGGEIYVANRGSTSIRAFASDGRFLREFGRAGDGPGEFRLISVLWMTGDTVVAIDWQGGGRVSLFGRRGDLLDNWASSNPADGTRHTLLSNSPAGWIASVQGRPPSSGAVHLLDHKTRAVGALVGSYPSPIRVLPMQGGEGGRDWPLFEPRPSGSAYMSGYMIRVPDLLKYEIQFIDHTGRVQRTITHSYTPTPIGAAQVAAYKALMEQHYVKRGPIDGAETIQQSLARIDARAKLPMVPHTSPFWRWIAGADGELWVERADLVKDPARVEYERTFPESNRQLKLPEPDSRWDRFDSQGRFQGQITLPGNFRALAIDRGAVYGVAKNADDVEFVVRMRVPAPPRLGVKE